MNVYVDIEVCLKGWHWVLLVQIYLYELKSMSKLKCYQHKTSSQKLQLVCLCPLPLPTYSSYLHTTNIYLFLSHIQTHISRYNWRQKEEQDVMVLYRKSISYNCHWGTFRFSPSWTRSLSFFSSHFSFSFSFSFSFLFLWSFFSFSMNSNRFIFWKE